MSPTSIINNNGNNDNNDSSITEHVAKKLKISPSSSSSSMVMDKNECNYKDVFAKGLLDIESRNNLRKTVDTSKPYKHCKIDQLVNDTLLRKVKKEIMDNIQFTAKETDIYKVNQTGDLANMDGLPINEKERLKHLFQLREAIYSQTFRDFISEVTQCGPLSAKKMDMSVNIYNQGCHLLNHDDVIGDRCVSFILYMPDDSDDQDDDSKENGWKMENGGALELYGVTEEGKPANEPDVCLLPQWNSFAFFMVVPGYSFHAVQEVISPKKSRLSIQGWFHYPQQDEFGYDPNQLKNLMTSKSSLEHLLEDVQEEFHPYEKIYDPDTIQLDDDDKQKLSIWMNEKYLNQTQLEELSHQFIEKSSLQLEHLLQPSLYHDIMTTIYKADEEDDYLKPKLPNHRSGIREGSSWYVQGSPISQRYLKLNRSKNDDKDDDDQEEKTSQLFNQLLNHFESSSFRKWLTYLTKLILKKYKTAIARRFRPGLDYTLATLPIQHQQQPILDVTLSLLPSSSESSSELLLWEQGDVGGYLCYMENDNNDDASIYRSSDQDGALLMIPCKGNELSIVLRGESVMKFIKYVSANAFGSRWDISLEYETFDDDDEEKV